MERESGNNIDMSVFGHGHHIVQIGRADAVNFGAPSEKHVPPWQGPAPAANFFNRTTELGLLNTIMDRESPLVLVDGGEEVGKTNLIAKWALQARQRFPDGFIYQDFRSPVHADGINVTEALGSMLRSLGVPDEAIKSDVIELQKLWFSVAASAKLLVVLDELDDPALLRFFRPPSPGTTVVVVSRFNTAAFRAEGAQQVSVGPFSDLHSIGLLEQVCEPDRWESDPEAARELVTLCAGRPRSVSLLGGYLATKTDLTVRQVLQKVTARGARPSPDVVASIARSLVVDNLDADVRRLYEQLVHHPRGSFSTGLATGLGGGEAGTLLAEMRDRGLVAPAGPDDPSGPDRWELTGGVRDEPDPDVMRRIVDWYRRAARQADLAYLSAQRLRIVDVEAEPPTGMPELDHEAAIGWLETELPNLVALQQYAADAGWDDAVVSFEESLWVLYMQHGHSGYRARTSRLALDAAARVGDPRGLSRMAAQRSRHLKEAGEYDAAIEQLNHARSLADEVDDDSLRASAIEMLGRVYFAQGRHDEAASEYLAALEIYRTMGTPEAARGIAIMRRFLGEVYAQDGNLDQAVRLYQLSRENFASYGLRRDEGAAALGLGLAYADLGNLELAQATLEAADHLLGETRQLVRGAAALKALGDLHQSEAHLESAGRYWRQALEVHAKLHNVDTEAVKELTAKVQALPA